MQLIIIDPNYQLTFRDFTLFARGSTEENRERLVAIAYRSNNYINIKSLALSKVKATIHQA